MKVGSQETELRKFERGRWCLAKDSLVKEEPLEVRLRYGPVEQRREQTLAILMRTPGEDEMLVPGLLFTEQLIHRASDILNMRYEQNQTAQPLHGQRIVVELAATHPFPLRAEGPLIAGNSACGICNATVMDQLDRQPAFIPLAGQPTVEKEILLQLPRKLREAQELFGCTGGLHAAALFSPFGKCLQRFEDVGRHNALDKLIGHALRNEQIPLHHRILMLSGRISFELVQKAAMAGIAFICAIGAPSSAAVHLAQTHGITLVGFLKKNSFNLYTHSERIST